MVNKTATGKIKTRALRRKRVDESRREITNIVESIFHQLCGAHIFTTLRLRYVLHLRTDRTVSVISVPTTHLQQSLQRNSWRIKVKHSFINAASLMLLMSQKVILVENS